MFPRRLKLNLAIPAAHQKIFTFLLKVNEERKINATLRVAGGWVRDALLGLHSQDIDIAIESPESRHISGEAFAREVSAYQEAMGMTARTVSVIRVNPELSKHIETATVCVYDIAIEFCALRHDEYTNSNSRIPEVRSATALEDAQRRDYTINALFYNLHTMEVEDYINGFEDLKDRVLRCPLSPIETLSDDPLRLLRGIRFVGQLSELGFFLDESITRCVDEDLLEKLRSKVSRERIGKEFVKMLSGPSSEKCIEILFDMNILQRILLAEVYLNSGKKDKVTAEVKKIIYLVSNDLNGDDNLNYLLLLNRTLAPFFSKSDSHLFVQSPSEKLVAMLFILCLPFYRAVASEEVPDRLYALCLNGLKLPSAVYNVLLRMIECYQSIVRHELDSSLITSENVSDEVKLAVFEGLVHLNDKKVVVPFAFKIIFSVYLLFEQKNEHLLADNIDAVESVAREKWHYLEREPGLLDAMSRPLPLKGNEISKLVSIDNRKIGLALLALRRYLLLRPQATQDEMIAWLKEEKNTL